MHHTALCMQPDQPLRTEVRFDDDYEIQVLLYIQESFLPLTVIDFIHVSFRIVFSFEPCSIFTKESETHK